MYRGSGGWCFRCWWSLGSGSFGPSLSYPFCILRQRFLPHFDSSIFLLDFLHEIFDVTRSSIVQLSGVALGVKIESSSTGRGFGGRIGLCIPFPKSLSMVESRDSTATPLALPFALRATPSSLSRAQLSSRPPLHSMAHGQTAHIGRSSILPSSSPAQG